MVNGFKSSTIDSGNNEEPLIVNGQKLLFLVSLDFAISNGFFKSSMLLDRLRMNESPSLTGCDLGMWSWKFLGYGINIF